MAKKKAKKTVQSANKKKAVKKTAKKTAKPARPAGRKAVKKATKVVKKAAKKVVKKKAAPKPIKKVAKKAAKKVAAKPARKAISKAAKKAVKKLVKKAAKKSVQKATNKKVAKKTVKKAVKKVVKKAIKKIVSAPKKAIKKIAPIAKKAATTPQKAVVVNKPAIEKPTLELGTKADIKKIIDAKTSEEKQVSVKTENKTISATKATNGIKTEVQKLADIAVEGILELKGKNISVLNLTGIQNRVCDYFIICQADSSTQVSAIADSVIETVKKTTGERPYRSEGFENSEWILIDYVTVVVHVFQSHIREFYNLESLWADAEETKIAFD